MPNNFMYNPTFISEYIIEPSCVSKSKYCCYPGGDMSIVTVMVLNATFNNISAISWLSVLLVEETRVHGVKPPICHKSPERDSNSQR